MKLKPIDTVDWEVPSSGLHKRKIDPTFFSPLWSLLGGPPVNNSVYGKMKMKYFHKTFFVPMGLSQ